jgi:type IV pilus assembly protein PilP
MRSILTVTILAGLAAGCSSDQDELRAWMDDVRKNTAPIRETIAEPKRFEPFRYDNVAQIDPFSQNKLKAAMDKLAQRSKSGLAPDLARRREPLESYPLESIRMVGHMSNGKQNFALLQVESLVYQAHVGAFAGQNFGQITRVSEGEIKLKELVQDASGEWVERETALRLQEKAK